MTRKPFRFKQFSIYDDECAMKVGTDGVLLGAWAPVDTAKYILDIGTGTGLIAIMLAQRTTMASVIDAIEIDQAAYHQAIENIANCRWKNRISPVRTSLQEYVKESPPLQYDLIVSNPPFFSAGSKPIPDRRINARHTDTLSHQELIDCSKSLLTAHGLLSMILPASEGRKLIRIAESAQLYCQHCVEVRSKQDKPVERLLLTFAKVRPKSTISEHLIIQYEKRNDYTPEYIQLTKEFYLKM